MALQLVKPISLGNVYAEFSAPNGTPLGSFVRNGAFVPDYPENAGVPTSKPISLGDMLGAAAGTSFTMVAGLTQTQNTGFDIGDQTVNQIGTLDPADYLGREVHRIRRDNSGLNITIFQQDQFELEQDFWTKVTFTANPLDPWNGIVGFSADASFASNTGRASWNGIVDPGAFINGQTYQVLWER